jgi:membrane protease subunit (stomatin/prohibitin family)
MHYKIWVADVQFRYGDFIMQYIQIGNYKISKLILGGNPFSAISHQSMEIDEKMRRFYTSSQIKDILRNAESLGVNAVVARGDAHISRLMYEYHHDGGKIQWLTQTCPEFASIDSSIGGAMLGGAIGCHIHGGVMDNLIENNKGNEIPAMIAKIRNAGMLAGAAGHLPATFEWAKDNLDVDYFMCSYYNPIPRVDNASHIHGFNEQFLPEDREAMTAIIKDLPKPVIHYKVLAAGRTKPHEAFDYVKQHLRAKDAVCVGVFPQAKRDMLAEDIELLLKK